MDFTHLGWGTDNDLRDDPFISDKQVPEFLFMGAVEPRLNSALSECF